MARWALNRDLDALRQKKAAPTPPTTNGNVSQAKDTDMQDTKPSAPGDASTSSSTAKPTEETNPSAPAAAANGTAANDTSDAIDFDALFNDPSDAPAEQEAASEATFLPGLESYANNDSADGAADQPAASQTNNSQQQNGNQEPSFDDLMNFDGFDFNSLGADGDDGGATFDESFFDVE